MPSPSINTKQVSGRRAVRYEPFDEILANAEHLAARPTQTLGNWSVGQIFCHLAKSADVLIDDVDQRGQDSFMPIPGEKRAESRCH